MHILDWYRRYADHVQEAVDTSVAGWAPGVSSRPDFDWEWPNITGDDSGFWEQMEAEDDPA